jgi:hypothetical protein
LLPQETVELLVEDATENFGTNVYEIDALPFVWMAEISFFWD